MTAGRVGCQLGMVEETCRRIGGSASVVTRRGLIVHRSATVDHFDDLSVLKPDCVRYHSELTADTPAVIS